MFNFGLEHSFPEDGFVAWLRTLQGYSQRARHFQGIRIVFLESGL